MFSFEDINKSIGHYDFDLIGAKEDLQIEDVALIGKGGPHSLIWVGEEFYNANKDSITQLGANLIITDADLPSSLFQEKSVRIKHAKPRLLFSKIVNDLFVELPTVPQQIHPEAEIAPDVYIGPNCTIGKAKIGAGTRIWGNTFIHDGVEIGKNCLIDACCVIGADGFGHVKDEHNEWYKFPHIGKTIIEDNVEIGANTYITKGALGATRIGRGAKIALSVCIGHNVQIGRRSIILSNAIIGGSTEVGEDAWVSITASVKHGLKVGDKAVIGMGAVVIRDVGNSETVVGNPAKVIRK